MRNRRKGLSFGSLLLIFLAMAALFGTYYFVQTVAKDSHAAEMGLSEFMDALGKPFQVRASPTSYSVPVSTEAILPSPSSIP